MEDFFPHFPLVDAISKLYQAAHTAFHHPIGLGGIDLMKFMLKYFFGETIVDKIEASGHTAAAIRVAPSLRSRF